MLDVGYKLLGTDPVSATVKNVSGSAYDSHSGTPNNSGRWIIRITSGQGAEATLMAQVKEYETMNLEKRVPVFASGSFTTLIPGMTITLSATVNVGDYFRVTYSRLVPESP